MTDRTETTAERMARLHPLHYQRIAENTAIGHENADHRLGMSASREDLSRLFVWSSTPEGHEYWCALYEGERK